MSLNRKNPLHLLPNRAVRCFASNSGDNRKLIFTKFCYIGSRIETLVSPMYTESTSIEILTENRTYHIIWPTYYGPFNYYMTVLTFSHEIRWFQIRLINEFDFEEWRNLFNHQQYWLCNQTVVITWTLAHLFSDLYTQLSEWTTCHIMSKGYIQCSLKEKQITGHWIEDATTPKFSCCHFKQVQFEIFEKWCNLELNEHK